MQTLQPELREYILELASVDWSTEHLRDVCQVGEPSSNLALMQILRSRATILKISECFGGFWQSLLWNLKERGERDLLLSAYQSASYFHQAKSCAEIHNMSFYSQVTNRLRGDIEGADLWDNTVCFFLDKDTVMFFVFVDVDGKVGMVKLKVELDGNYPTSELEMVSVKKGESDEWLPFDMEKVNEARVGYGLICVVNSLISLTLPKLKRMGCLIFENQGAEFNSFCILADVRRTDGLDTVLVDGIQNLGIPEIPNAIGVRNLNMNTTTAVVEIVNAVNSGDEEEMVVLIQPKTHRFFRKLTCGLGLAHVDHLVSLNQILLGIPNSRYIGNNNVFVTGFLEKNVKGLTIVRHVPRFPQDDTCLPDE